MLKQPIPISQIAALPHFPTSGSDSGTGDGLSAFLTSLSALAASSASSAPTVTAQPAPPTPAATPAPGEKGALDALLLAAAVEGAGEGGTRHHLSHAAWARSMQMPRNERLRMMEERGMGVLTPPAELEGAELVEGEVEDVSGPLSGRARSPPTPPSAPVSKKARVAPADELSAAALGTSRITIRTSTTTTKTITTSTANVESAAPAAVGLSAALKTEPVVVKCLARTRIPTAYGPVFLHVYQNSQDGKEHLAIVSDPQQLETPSPEEEDEAYVPIRSYTLDSPWHPHETAQERITRGAYLSRLSPHSPPLPAPVPRERRELKDPPLVRIHSECFTGETLGSLRCDCGEQLDSSLSLIARSPSKRGIILYLRQEGRGIGLLEKVRAYNLQDLGMDTVQANLALGRGEDERTYGVAGAMLRDLGVGGEGVRLMTNNPDKVRALEVEGIRVRERVGLVPRDWQVRADHSRSHSHPHSHEHGQDNLLPPTALHTPDLCPALPSKPAQTTDWDHRSKGATIVGSGTVRSEELERYLRTKVERMGHLLELPTAPAGKSA